MRLSAPLFSRSLVVAALLAGCGGGDLVYDEHGDHEHEYDAVGEFETEPEDTGDNVLQQALVSCHESTSTGYNGGKPYPIRVVTADGKPSEKKTANAYAVMQAAAARDGVGLRVVSGFRSQQEQQYLYACYKNCSCNGCNLAAKPGYSNHQSGEALDLNTRERGVLTWLTRNGARFGFYRTVPKEPWHWEYKGGGPGGGPCGSSLVQGQILAKYNQLGGTGSVLGHPTTAELKTPDGIGRYNHFQHGSIYWTPATGAYAVQGEIRAKWAAMRWEASVLGYPVTDELPTPDKNGRYNHFQRGSIYWTPATGAHFVMGAIRHQWAAMGWENSLLGYPVTDETPTPDGVGRYNHFQNGSIYWTAKTGAHAVYGHIRQKWASMGWESSALGYPITSEYAVPGGRRSDFQNGSLFFNGATGKVEVTLK